MGSLRGLGSAEAAGVRALVKPTLLSPHHPNPRRAFRGPGSVFPDLIAGSSRWTVEQ